MAFESRFHVLRSRQAYVAAVIALLLILTSELLFSVRHLSQTTDEGAHLYAGYQHWRARDFGVNPEHPPLVKLVAAAPLLGMHLRQPHPPPVFFLGEEYMGGGELLYGNDADALLWRARVAASTFTLVLALLVFAAAREMFGATAGLLGLALFTFEPTLLAHGALVTTDMGVTCGIFAAVYAFYRYMKQPTAGRLLLCGLALGLALSTKLSGVVAIPALAICAAAELLREWWNSRQKPAAEGTTSESAPEFRPGRRALRAVGALAVIYAMGYIILWAFYTFRYAARPAGAAMVPTLAQFAGFFPPPLKIFVLDIAKWHVLPEAYVYGFLWIPVNAFTHPVFLLGRVYPSGLWYYFPIALLIKCTLPLLLLLVLAPFVFWRVPERYGRELIFLIFPPLGVLGTAMLSHLNIGVRHVLPVFPFLIVIAAATAWMLIRSSRPWAYAVAALLIFQIVSSVHNYPDYLTYGNEAFGGPAKTYKVLGDSNVDWSQQAKEIREYVQKHGIRDCWLAYGMPGGVDKYYGLPCKPMPTGLALWMQMPQEVVPRQISGTLLVSTIDASGLIWGPGEMNPYQRFQQGHPDGMIGNSVLVYHGTYDMPVLAAESHLMQIPVLLRVGRKEAALKEEQVALEIAPDSASVQAQAGGALWQMGQKAEAEQAFAEAMQKARAHRPDDQSPEVAKMVAMAKRPPL